MVKEKKSKLKQAGLVLLVIISLFITGCTPNPIDTQIYFNSYIIHDFSGEDKIFEPPKRQDYSTYEFSYNFPGLSPETYEGAFFFFPPGVIFAGSTLYPILGGVNQKVFAYAFDEFPEISSSVLSEFETSSHLGRN